MKYKDKNNDFVFFDVRYNVINILSKYREKWIPWQKGKTTFDELVNKACSYCEILLTTNHSPEAIFAYLEKVQETDGSSHDSFYEALDYLFDLYINYNII